MRKLLFKRGSYLALTTRFYNKNKQQIILKEADLANVKCRINNPNKEKIVDLTISATDTIGTYILSTDEDTSGFELCEAKGDVLIYINDKPLYSYTFKIEITDFETPKPEEV